MHLLLVYSYFLLVSKCCLDAVDPGINDQINQLLKKYMQLELKFGAVSNENIWMKKRLDELSTENLQLKHRVTNLEKLEHQVVNVLQENVFLRQEVSKLGDRIKESQHEKTFGTNTIAIPNQKNTDFEDRSNANRRGRDIENSMLDHPDKRAQNTNKKAKTGLRKDRDAENLIPDHLDFEQHIQKTVENFGKTEKEFRAGRDMENLILDHPVMEYHEHNTYFKKTEKEFRAGRYMENLNPYHPDMEHHEHNTNFKKTEIEFRNERYIENAIPDHAVFDQYLSGQETHFRGERDIENTMSDHQNSEQNTQNESLYQPNNNVYEIGLAKNKDVTKKRLLTDTVQQPTPGLGSKVAFSVSLSAELSLGQHQIVEYDTIVTNIGNGYDTRHGHFTAPSKAIYLFSCSIMSAPANDLYMYLEMVKNGSRIAFLFAIENGYHFATQVVMVALDKGDMVWVRNVGPTGSKSNGYGYNTFAGAILF